MSRRFGCHGKPSGPFKIYFKIVPNHMTRHHFDSVRTSFVMWYTFRAYDIVVEMNSSFCFRRISFDRRFAVASAI